MINKARNVILSMKPLMRLLFGLTASYVTGSRIMLHQTANLYALLLRCGGLLINVAVTLNVDVNLTFK